MNKAKTQRSPWMIMVVMLISMMAGAICMNKVAPVLLDIQTDFNITSSAQAGLLMSIFTFSGIILSIPMGILITRYGTFRTGLFSLIAIIAGSALGAVAGGYVVMLISRLVEGIGLIFLGTLGPAAVARAFSNRKSAMAMGILMCYMSFGQIVALNIAPIMAANGSWRNFWWVSAGFGVLALVLWVMLLRNDNADSEVAAVVEGEKITLGQVISNRSVLLIVVTFFTWCVVHFGVFNYLPTYMTEVGGISATKAGSLTSIASLIGIPIGILGGVLADKWGSIRKPLALNLILFAVVVAITPMFTSSTFMIYVILYGIVAMAEAGLSFAAVTTVVKAEEAAIASATLSTGMWLGAFLSTLIFGAFLDVVGWTKAFYFMIPIAMVSILATSLNKRLK